LAEGSIDEDDILAQRSTATRPDHHPGRWEAERARALAKAMERLPVKARVVERAQAKALAADYNTWIR
jgi:hypothetical protein